jgi:hypothetical protein
VNIILISVDSTLGKSRGGRYRLPEEQKIRLALQYRQPRDIPRLRHAEGHFSFSAPGLVALYEILLLRVIEIIDIRKV